jgi:hypothetical protein
MGALKANAQRKKSWMLPSVMIGAIKYLYDEKQERLHAEPFSHAWSAATKNQSIV